MHWPRQKEKLRKTKWMAQLRSPGASCNATDWLFVAQVECDVRGCGSSYAVYRRVLPLLRDSEIQQIKKEVRQITRASHPSHSSSLDGAV